MRLSKYKEFVDEATILSDVFSDLLQSSPRQTQIDLILNKARDDDRLFDGEFVELYQYAQLKRVENASSSTTEQQASSEEAVNR